MKTFIILLSFAWLAVLSNAYNFQPDTNVISGVIRDFWPCKNLASCGKYGVSGVECDPSACLPDFEMDTGTQTNGLVLDYLDADRKPIYNNATTNSINITNSTTFWYWFHTASPFNIAFNVNITLSNTVCSANCDGHTYGYKNDSYYPLTNMGFGNYGPSFSQNYHFCLELHLRFTYRGDEIFSFTGDDDVWVFINDHLVIDLGGIHVAQTKAVQLNSTTILHDMIVGQTYAFDMFYCERHTTQSDLALYTDLALACPYYDWCGVCQGDGQECCDCNDDSVCTTDLCDLYTGECIFKPTLPPGDTSNLCRPWACDPVTGWAQSTLNCNDGNYCTEDSCTPATGCSNQYNYTICDDGNTCTNDTCIPSSGCLHQQIPNDPCSGQPCVNGQPPSLTCKSVDLCQPQVCLNLTCVTAYIVTCDDGNPCTNDTCTNGVCSNVAVNCDDNNVCTTDTCVNGQCVHNDTTVSTCDDGNLCTNDLCNATTGCYYTNVTFQPVFDCKNSYCDPKVGVITAPIQCYPKKSCSCVNNACVCTSNFLASTPAKIGAGVLAAIIIAAVVGIIIFVVAGKKGYDYYQHAHAATVPLGSNPLYVGNQNQGQNPLYSDEGAV